MAIFVVAKLYPFDVDKEGLIGSVIFWEFISYDKLLFINVEIVFWSWAGKLKDWDWDILIFWHWFIS